MKRRPKTRNRVFKRITLAIGKNNLINFNRYLKFCKIFILYLQNSLKMILLISLLLKPSQNLIIKKFLNHATKKNEIKIIEFFFYLENTFTKNYCYLLVITQFIFFIRWRITMPIDLQILSLNSTNRFA